MVALPISRPYAVLLYALLTIWAALLILGFAFGQLDEDRVNRIPRFNKILSALILVICALIWWRAGALEHHWPLTPRCSDTAFFSPANGSWLPNWPSTVHWARLSTCLWG